MVRNTSTAKVTDQTQSNNDLDIAKPKGATRSSPTQPQMMECARNQATFDSSKLTELILGG
jgi:hypothetical protein